MSRLVQGLKQSFQHRLTVVGTFSGSQIQTSTIQTHISLHKPAHVEVAIKLLALLIKIPICLIQKVLLVS